MTKLIILNVSRPNHIALYCMKPLTTASQLCLLYVQLKRIYLYTRQTIFLVLIYSGIVLNITCVKICKSSDKEKVFIRDRQTLATLRNKTWGHFVHSVSIRNCVIALRWETTVTDYLNRNYHYWLKPSASQSGLHSVICACIVRVTARSSMSPLGVAASVLKGNSAV